MYILPVLTVKGLKVHEFEVHVILTCSRPPPQTTKTAKFGLNCIHSKEIFQYDFIPPISCHHLVALLAITLTDS